MQDIESQGDRRSPGERVRDGVKRVARTVTGRQQDQARELADLMSRGGWTNQIGSRPLEHQVKRVIELSKKPDVTLVVVRRRGRTQNGCQLAAFEAAKLQFLDMTGKRSIHISLPDVALEAVRQSRGMYECELVVGFSRRNWSTIEKTVDRSRQQEAPAGGPGLRHNRPARR